MRILKLLSFVLICLTLAVAISGCAGSKTRESTGEYFDDSVIANKVRVSLIRDSKVKFGHVNVETFKGVVQLSGFVNSTEEATRAVELTRRIKGVKQVNNSLIIK